MEHFEGKTKTKQNKNKNKQTNKKNQENLTHLWDLQTKSPTLGVEKNKTKKKQTNKDKTNRRQKTRPNSMPDEIKIMMCAEDEESASWFTHFFFQIILWPNY